MTVTFFGLGIFLHPFSCFSADLGSHFFRPTLGSGAVLPNLTDLAAVGKGKGQAVVLLHQDGGYLSSVGILFGKGD
jgi:hypothetical protein